ncbi:MAG: hypothetical protein REI78_16360 [Pedobacter sp.]|nr:hypothetical protein [Pedobacter sp.]
MKNLNLKSVFRLLILFTLLWVQVSCKNELLRPKELTLRAYRTIGYNYLDEPSRASIVGDWGLALVTDQVVDGKKLKAVIFHTRHDSILGPIVVYISPETHTALGIAPRF